MSLGSCAVAIQISTKFLRQEKSSYSWQNKILGTKSKIPFVTKQRKTNGLIADLLGSKFETLQLLNECILASSLESQKEHKVDLLLCIKILRIQDRYFPILDQLHQITIRNKLKALTFLNFPHENKYGFYLQNNIKDSTSFGFSTIIYKRFT